MSSITPVKAGRSLRRKKTTVEGEGDDRLDFTSPDFKVNPNMISYHRNFKTTAKKNPTSLKSSEKLDKHRPVRRRQNVADTEAFMREAPGKKEAIDIYSGNLKDYDKTDSIRQNENAMGIESMAQMITIGKSPDSRLQNQSSMLQHWTCKNDLNDGEINLRTSKVPKHGGSQSLQPVTRLGSEQ